MTHPTRSAPVPHHQGYLPIAGICNLTSYVGALLILLLNGCQPVTAATTPTPAASYSLIVLNGTGGGRYQAGSVVHVWANPYQRGWAFDRWQGETQTLPDVRSLHTMLTMPAKDIRIEASYKQIPEWDATPANLSGRDVYSYFPPSNCKGVIVFFHGSGGEASEWLDLGMEGRHFFDDAVAAGYAILSINSANRVDKQWDLNMPPASNADLDAVEAILTAFQANGKIPAQVPAYAVGMSQGGRFASLAGYILDMKATAIWVGLGHDEVLPITTVPTTWCLADHDPIIDKQAVLAQYQQLLERGIDASLYVHPQTPLYPLYFVNIPGIDSTASEQLFSDFASQGYLDEDYFLNENPRISRWEKHIGLRYSEAIRLDIQDRLFVAYAEHAFYSECDHRVLDFFDLHP